MRQLTFLHLGFALCIMLVSISYTSSGKMTSKAGIQKNGPGADYLQHCFQTLYPSYAMENHGFYHPSYQMVAGMSVGDSYLMAQIINPKVAKELKPFAEHNVENVWQFLKGIILETGDLAFPSGLDWSLNSFDHVSYIAWLATNFNDPQAQWVQPRLLKAPRMLSYFWKFQQIIPNFL